MQTDNQGSEIRVDQILTYAIPVRRLILTQLAEPDV